MLYHWLAALYAPHFGVATRLVDQNRGADPIDGNHHDAAKGGWNAEMPQDVQFVSPVAEY